MRSVISKLLSDQTGFVVSAEVMVIVTLLFCATVVGYAVVRDALVQELGDIGEMVGSVSQSYNVTGIQKRKNDGFHARCSGFGFNDNSDACDCQGITIGDANSVAGKVDPNVSGTRGTFGG
jgi:hypothetical protein